MDRLRSGLTFHPPADLALGTLSSHFPGYPARKYRREGFNPDLISLPIPPHSGKKAGERWRTGLAKDCNEESLQAPFFLLNFWPLPSLDPTQPWWPFLPIFQVYKTTGKEWQPERVGLLAPSSC